MEWQVSHRRRSENIKRETIIAVLVAVGVIGFALPHIKFDGSALPRCEKGSAKFTTLGIGLHTEWPTGDLKLCNPNRGF